MALGNLYKVVLVAAAVLACRHAEVAQAPLQQAISEPVKVEGPKVDTSICSDNAPATKEALQAIIDAVDAEQCPEALTKLAGEEVIDLSHLQLQTASVLTQLFNVRELDLGFNNLASLHGLEKLGELKVLTVDNNQILSLEFVKTLKNLVWLNVAGNRIEDLSPLKDLLNLERLDLTGNKVKDLTPIKDLANLKELRLDGNPINKKPTTCPNQGKSLLVRQFCGARVAH